MRPFDLVVLDLDGTILNPFKREAISPLVHDTIAAVQAAGVPVTIGTGRTLDYIRHQLPGDFGLTTPVIATQGAVIGDPATGHVLAEQDLPLDVARVVARYVDDTRFPTAFYFNDDAGHSTIYRNYRGRTEEEEDLLQHLLGYPGIQIERFSQLLADTSAHPPIKVIGYNRDLPGGLDLLSEYERRFVPPLSVTRTHTWLVEATAPGVDKGSGLLRLCAMLGVAPERVMAVGDSENDIPMLQAAGFAVAMGNATPALKAVADWIAPSLDEEGAAVALQRWVLEPLGL